MSHNLYFFSWIKTRGPKGPMLYWHGFCGHINPEHVCMGKRQQTYSLCFVFGLPENVACSTSEPRKYCKQISCMNYFNMCQVKVIWQKKNAFKTVLIVKISVVLEVKKSWSKGQSQGHPRTTLINLNKHSQSIVLRWMHEHTKRFSNLSRFMFTKPVNPGCGQ